MARLINTHKGSTSEHLASTILSKFCFLATPTKSLDDIGADLFCTIYIKRKRFLIPTKSFSLQIKSNKRNIISIAKFSKSTKLINYSFLTLIFMLKIIINIRTSSFRLFSYWRHATAPPKLTSLRQSLVKYASENCLC